MVAAKLIVGTAVRWTQVKILRPIAAILGAEGQADKASIAGICILARRARDLDLNCAVLEVSATYNCQHGIIFWLIGKRNQLNGGASAIIHDFRFGIPEFQRS